MMRVKPMPGTLWCHKQSKPKARVHVAGIGMVEVEAATAGGLLIPFTDNRGDVNLKTSMFVVESIGDDLPWRIDKTDYRTTFAEQGIVPGVVIATRAGAGLDQRREADHINVRYNEIAAIGNMEEDGPPMYPAPGWVLCRVLKQTAPGRTLTVSADYEDALEQPQAVRMVVEALPRGQHNADLAPGDIVYMARFTAQNFVEFEDNTWRCVPLEDILAKEFEA
jgi:hypothetical protein